MAVHGCYSKFYTSFFTKHKNYVTGGILLASSPFYRLTENREDIDKNLLDVQSKEQESRPNQEETGMDRLKMMFSRDQLGDVSPELTMVSEGTIIGIFVGSLIGGTIHSKESHTSFIEKNQATVFHNQLDAKKRLQDKVYTGFFRGAWMWGWRMGLFTGTFTLVSTSVAVYRGKSSVLEYILGGSVAGVIYKIKQGPKAMVAGGVIGGFLGAVGGSISLAAMYLTGTTTEDLRYWRYKWKEDYQKSKLEKLKEYREKHAQSYFQGKEQMNMTENALETLDQNVPDQSNTST